MRHIPKTEASCQPEHLLRVDGRLPLARRVERWLLPPRCVLCLEAGMEVATGLVAGDYRGALLDLCPACHAELPWRLPLAVLATGKGAGLRVPEGVTLVYAPLAYAWPVSPLVHALKDRGERVYGRVLATVLAAAAVHARLPLPEVFVPVPLHPARERQRGFNQSRDLAHRLARDLGGRLVPALRRLRDTPAQAGLTAVERRTNLLGAFALDEAYRRRVAGGHLALVDDVLTTGSTALACAAVLRAAGARRVDVWAVARA